MIHHALLPCVFYTGQLGNQAQRYGESFQLIMRAQEKLRGVVAWVAFDFLNLYFSRSQWLACLGLLRGIGGISVYVIHDPAIEPALHVVPFIERADFVSYDAFQIVCKAAACK